MNTTTSPSVTFAVDSVAVGEELLPVEKAHASVEKLLGASIEACDTYNVDVVEQPGFHSLIAAARLAYFCHFPLVLSPDVIWLTIAQGLANHINNNAEQLRRRLVPHEGKAVINIRRDDFVKSSPENPWEEVFPLFSDEIKKVIGPQAHTLILSDFSTTGTVERAASEIVLMDCVKSYFRYEYASGCGIPSITLEGTVDDWEKVQSKVTQLESLDLGWWTGDLRQITSEFVNALKGSPKQEFWSAIYRQSNESGGPYTTGWLVRLLPYLKRFDRAEAKLRNGMVGKPLIGKQGSWEGVTDDQLPSSASQVPFVWNYFGKEYDYQFIAGVLTVTQDKDTKSLRPRIGWAVRRAV